MGNTAVKISDELAAWAREEALTADRSMAGQIEHWAKLGRAVENSFTVSDLSALKGSGGNLEQGFPEAEDRAVARALLAKLREELPSERLRERLRRDFRRRGRKPRRQRRPQSGIGKSHCMNSESLP